MKNNGGCGCFLLIIFLLIGWLILQLASCTKQYEQHPTCFKYLQLIDQFTGERDYIRTDTTYPGGLNEYVCDNDTMIFHRKPDTLGCATGYFSYRYIKNKK